MGGRPSYESRSGFRPGRVNAVAVYCSDGRWAEAIDEFLHHILAVDRCDRLAVPGGAAALAGHLRAWREESALREQLRFLIEVHLIRRAILIAHQDCAFYARVAGLEGPAAGQRQVEDVLAAARVISSMATGLAIEAYQGVVDGAKTRFITLDVSETRP